MAGYRSLIDCIRERHPEVDDPVRAIGQGRVLVDGRVVLNPNSRVRRGASISIRKQTPLRGEAKLRAALQAFPVQVSGRVALDAGSSAGGFVRVLLEHGATRVYAVDAGHGQLLGSLRQDPRVVNLEGTNISALDRSIITDAVDVVTLDLSYLSLASAIGYLENVPLAKAASLLALVKPMFELGLPRPPVDNAKLERACLLAEAAIAAAGWSIRGRARSPVQGSRGAVEFWIWAARADGDRLS
ncbi:MAG TPA: SAM-dependent methyltransferase [Candidatus Eisenbacteria bacterium]|nr:SAM-dependent methyltransferase [Candidatus Eisenbacteria bacterium]